jgi:tRNA wybutosine-synthesizing protein 3
MSFEKEKNDFLMKIDKSKKGSIDKDIRKAVDIINSMPDFYTKSSCSGRIIVMEKRSDKKQDVRWLFTKHNPATLAEIKKILRKLPPEDIWFKEEPAILHVCCRDIAGAKDFLNLSKTVFKRTGIIGIRNYITIEIIGTEMLDTIIARKGKLAISEEYLRILVLEANKKMKRNKIKIQKFTGLLLEYKLGRNH